MKVNSKFAMTTSSKLQWMSCPHFLFFLQVIYLVTGGSNHLCCSTARKEKYNGTCHYATGIPSVSKGWQSLYFVLHPWGINLVKKTNPVFQVFIVYYGRAQKKKQFQYSVIRIKNGKKIQHAMEELKRDIWASHVTLVVKKKKKKKKTCVSMMEIQETRVCFQRCFQPSLEREMATHSSIFGWKTAWTEEPGGLQSTRQQSVRHDWALSHTHTHTHTQRISNSVLQDESS